jgi:hypothetical protein|tara:strand:- start:2039 stop:2515 length:477 start_codon:yes stop_codon:yes gene_type:complete
LLEEMSRRRKTNRLVFGVLGLAIIIVVSVIFIIPSITDSATIDSETNEQNELAISLVQTFNGIDEKGGTIKELIDARINVAYFFVGENIFNLPSTKIEWSAFHKPEEPGNIFEVHFSIKTFREDTQYIFYIDLENGEITSGNVDGKEVLKSVNSRSGI